MENTYRQDDDTNDKSHKETNHCASPPDWGFDTRILYISQAIEKHIRVQKKKSQNVTNDCTEVAKLWLNLKKFTSWSGIKIYIPMGARLVT